MGSFWGLRLCSFKFGVQVVNFEIIKKACEFFKRLVNWSRQGRVRKEECVFFNDAHCPASTTLTNKTRVN